MHDFQSTISGDTMAVRRARLGWSRQRLSEKTGIPAAVIAAIETGAKIATPTETVYLYEALRAGGPIGADEPFFAYDRAWRAWDAALYEKVHGPDGHECYRDCANGKRPVPLAEGELVFELDL